MTEKLFLTICSCHFKNGFELDEISPNLPFVSIKVRDHENSNNLTRRTKIGKGSWKKIEWNETFCFNLPQEHPTQLKISVKRQTFEDVYQSFGQITIPISSVPKNPTFEEKVKLHSFKLTKTPQNRNSEIKIKYWLIGTGINQLESSPNPIMKESVERQIEKRNESFRNLFNLPKEEILIYECAASVIRNVIIHYGRLYFSFNYVCFFSSLFGLKIIETIKFKEITAIFSETGEKLQNNIITVETKDRTVKLSHFLNFDIVYNQLVSSWKGEKKDSLLTHSLEDLTIPTDTLPGNFLKEHNNLTKICSSQFPIDIKQFFQFLLSDKSDFYNIYHETQGHKDLITGPWAPHPEIGQNVRNLSYRAPVKHFIGPNHTRIEETQRYYWKDENLILESVSVMHDIPYSDFFCVNALFQIEPLNEEEETEKKGCILTIFVACHFTKQTIFHDKIAEATISRTFESYSSWISLALQEIEKKNLNSNSIKMNSQNSNLSSNLNEFNENEKTQTNQKNNNLKKKYVPPSKRGHFLENITQHYGVFLTFPGTVFVLFIAFLVFFVLKIESLSDKVEELEMAIEILKNNTK